MNLADTLKLTPLELDILNHRLAVADALAEVLEGDYHKDDVVAVADLLAKGDLAAALRVSKVLVYDVLDDAVAGSTYLGSASSQSPQKQAAIYRAGESLACKVGCYIGRKLVYPVG